MPILIAVAKDANKLNGDSASSIDDGLRFFEI